MIRWAPLAVLTAMALVGPFLVGPVTPPTVGATAAQLLPPFSRVQHVALEGGGYARGPELTVLDDGLRIRTPLGWRTLTGFRASGEPRTEMIWLGTDHQGRGLLARMVHGARTSLIVATTATGVALAIGIAVGMAAGLGGAGLRRALLLITDGLLGLPRLLLLLMLGVLLHGSIAGLGLAIALVSWMTIARLVSAETIALRSRLFVRASVAGGASPAQISLRHVLPNLVPILTVIAPLVATDAILLESTLSFLGIAGGGGAVSWGQMVAEGQRLLPGGWWIVVFPGLLLSLTALAVHRLTPADQAQ